tara:strand:- start:286 stop:480 length:195 start_codon:yes stop_codon:yes gene_type:complete
MARKKKKTIQPINKVEIINRRTKTYRTINFKEKEIIVFNDDLKEFQRLCNVSASYDENNESNYE